MGFETKTINFYCLESIRFGRRKIGRERERERHRRLIDWAAADSLLNFLIFVRSIHAVCINRFAKFPPISSLRKSNRIGRTFMSWQPIGATLVNLNNLNVSYTQEHEHNTHTYARSTRKKRKSSEGRKREKKTNDDDDVDDELMYELTAQVPAASILLPHKIVALLISFPAYFLRCAHPDYARGVLFVQCESVESCAIQHTEDGAHHRSSSITIKISTIKKINL